jgi:hypothetical protein
VPVTTAVVLFEYRRQSTLVRSTGATVTDIINRALASWSELKPHGLRARATRSRLQDYDKELFEFAPFSRIQGTRGVYYASLLFGREFVTAHVVKHCAPQEAKRLTTILMLDGGDYVAQHRRTAITKLLRTWTMLAREQFLASIQPPRLRWETAQQTWHGSVGVDGRLGTLVVIPSP